MSIYGAMFSGVSGLFAQSQALGMISDNISNVNTIGYKGTQARFSTFVTRSASPSHYSPGGVRSQPFQTIDKQGLLQSAEGPTSLAVSGNGFFVVNQAVNPGIGNNYGFTRAGGFQPDDEGNLRNTAGYYLQGWRLSPDGSLAPGVNPNVLNELETVNISNLTGSVQPTTEISLQANLPADSELISPAPSTTMTMNGNLTYNAAGGGTATQTVQVFANDGTPYQVTLDFVQTNPAAAGTITWDQVNVTSIQSPTGASVGVGLPINLGALTFDEISGAATGGTATTLNLSTLTGGAVAGSPVAIDSTATTSGSGAQNISALANGSANLAASNLDDTYPATVQIFDSLGVGYNLTIRWVKTGATTGAGATATWSAYVQDLTRVSDGQQVAGAPADPDNPATWGAPIGTVTFDNTGKPVSTSSQPTATAGTPLSLGLDMSVYTLANGATWGDGSTTLDFGLGLSGDAAGLTQFSTDYLVDRIDQDGVQFGAFQGVQIDEQGFVTAIFDNGRSLKVFKVPLATFPNPNGLESRTGNTFIETDRSGAYFLRDAMSGGAGEIISGALESSTVDLATEFTNMIVTQRAYSASAKIITTADEMLDELVRIKR